MIVQKLALSCQECQLRSCYNLLMENFQPGDSVAWRWANGVAEGTVISVNSERTEIESKGKRIVRNGTAENPAVIIKHSSGTQVLKRASELQKTS